MLKILKGGKFAHPNPANPHIELIEGVERDDLDGAMTKALIDAGWAELTEEKEPTEKQATVEAQEEAGPEEVVKPVKKKRGRKKK